MTPTIAIIDNDMQRASQLYNMLSSERLVIGGVEAEIRLFTRSDDVSLEEVCLCQCACFIAMQVEPLDTMALMREMGERNYTGAIVLISDLDSRITELASDLARKYNVQHLGTIGSLSEQLEIHHLIEELDKYHNHLHEAESQVSEQALLDAISNRQIEPFFQPKLKASTQRVTSVEVLARIISPERKFPIMPGQFIPAAEQYGLINLITFQLIEKAVSDFPKLVALLGDECKVAINVSPTQLEDLQFPKQILTILEMQGIKPERIVLEITEEYQIRTSNQLETLNRLRMLNFGTSLDDFGAGYTNIRQLKRLPFTEVKIDRSLISYIDNDRFSQLIVNTLEDLAKELDINLVAEGVERPQELHYLRANHESIDLQGFWICKPLPLEGLIDWYHHWLEQKQRMEIYHQGQP